MRWLATAARTRQVAEWERTAWMLAKLHNVNCSRSADMLSPNDLNPMYRGPRQTAGGQHMDADFNASMCDALAAAEAKEAKERG